MSERWPRLMKRKTAAEYCDLSEAAFEREVMRARFPSGITIGGRDHWDRNALDAAITRLSGGSDVPDYRRKLRESCGEAA